jgi:hypothetical protein
MPHHRRYGLFLLRRHLLLAFANSQHLRMPKLLCESLLVGFENVCTRDTRAMEILAVQRESRTGLRWSLICRALCARQDR